MLRKSASTVWLLILGLAGATGCGSPSSRVLDTSLSPQKVEVAAPRGQGVSCSTCVAGTISTCPSCTRGLVNCGSCAGRGRVTLSGGSIKTQILCTSCGGKGDFGYINGIRQTCAGCQGSGLRDRTQNLSQESQCIACQAAGRFKCSKCNGTGSGQPRKCHICSGSGRIFKGENGYLGLGLEPRTEGAGVAVGEVVAGFPAERAGVREGDVLVRIGNKDIRTVDEAVTLLRRWLAGSEIPMAFMRQGERIELNLKSSSRAGVEPVTDSPALDHGPDTAEGFLRRAEENAKRSRVKYRKEIQEDCSRAIELGCRTVQVYKLRAWSRLFDDYEGALKDFASALDLAPNDASIYADRGYARRIAKDYDGAIRDFDTAMKLNPSSEDFVIGRAEARLGKGDSDGALQDFTLAIKLKPLSSEAYGKRADVRVKKGDLAGAQADYDKVVQLSPKFYGGYAKRGQFRHQKGDFKGALEDYKKAIELGDHLKSELTPLIEKAQKGQK